MRAQEERQLRLKRQHRHLGTRMVQVDGRSLDPAGGDTCLIQVAQGEGHFPAECHRPHETDPVPCAARALFHRARKLARTSGIFATDAFDIAKIGGWSRGTTRHMPHRYRLHAIKD
jgi:hypothetical protein